MEKILVIQTAFIGDAILTLPMIQKLKKMIPGSEIDVISNPVTSEIFSASPYVNKVTCLDKKGEHKSFFSLIKFAKEIRSRNYMRIYSPHRSFRTAFIVMQSAVRETYGFTNSSFRHVYKHLIDYRYDHHEVQRNLDLAGFDYSSEDWHILPELEIPGNVKENVRDFFANYNINNHVAVVAPGSVWNTKVYPAEYFKKIIGYLVDNYGKVLLIGGESDISLCTNLASGFKQNVMSVAGKFTLLETIELLKNSKILISNDSAPTHFGICVDIPVLTLYCSTTANFGFYPYNEKSGYLSYDDLFCKPCGIHGHSKCPVNTFDCGYNLKPETVISKIEEILNVKN
jgi:heptosyltransferase-2